MRPNKVYLFFCDSNCSISSVFVAWIDPTIGRTCQVKVDPTKNVKKNMRYEKKVSTTIMPRDSRRFIEVKIAVLLPC